MEQAFATLLSPVLLFFVLGVGAALARSDLAIPESIAKGLALYLMAAIGLKGGHEVAAAGLDGMMLATAGAGIALSALLPVLAYVAFRGLGRLGGLDAGAVAAHYGSVSVVTFVTALDVLAQRGTPAAGFLVGVMALMETPAIVTGLLLARRSAGPRPDPGAPAGLWHEVLLNGSVVLLVGSFVIGLLADPKGHEAVAPFFIAPFRGVLCLFLLDMGILAARRLREARALTWPLVALGLALPVVQGAIGAVIGAAIGLDTGTTAAFATLCASASYIAVPAAIRLALPEANPGLYLGLSLGVTFPFNLTVGIPLYTAMATWLTRG